MHISGSHYPTGSPDDRPLGVIAMLEDTDGDGRMDKRTEFATGIKFPNGVMCWRGGVIVTASPELEKAMTSQELADLLAYLKGEQ